MMQDKEQSFHSMDLVNYSDLDLEKYGNITTQNNKDFYDLVSIDTFSLCSSFFYLSRTRASLKSVFEHVR